MDLHAFEIQEETSKKYWNEIVSDELSTIYLKLFKKEINLSPDINSANFHKQILQKKTEQTAIVNYWNDHYSKFRLIENGVVLLKLEQSALMCEGFYAYELTFEKAVEIMNSLLEEGSHYSREYEKIKKREQIYIGLIVISTLLFLNIILL